MGFLLVQFDYTIKQNNLIEEGTSRFFWSLFKDEAMEIEKYRGEIETIEQVKQELRTDIIGHLIFSSDEDEELSFEENFKRYRKEATSFKDNMSDAMVFFFAINGFISQALNILMTCAQYNITPYLRYNVSYNYVLFVGSIFYKDENTRHMLNRIAITRICYWSFDKSKLKDVNFSTYVNYTRKHKINEKISKVMEKMNTKSETYQLDQIRDDIEQILSEVYLCSEK